MHHYISKTDTTCRTLQALGEFTGTGIVVASHLEVPLCTAWKCRKQSVLEWKHRREESDWLIACISGRPAPTFSHHRFGRNPQCLLRDSWSQFPMVPSVPFSCAKGHVPMCCQSGVFCIMSISRALDCFLSNRCVLRLKTRHLLFEMCFGLQCVSWKSVQFSSVAIINGYAEGGCLLCFCKGCDQEHVFYLV